MTQEMTNLTEIYDFGRAFKISIASLIRPNPLTYIQDKLPLKMIRVNPKEDIKHKQEFDYIMNYITQSTSSSKVSKAEKYDFEVSNIFRISEQELTREEEDK